MEITEASAAQFVQDQFSADELDSFVSSFPYLDYRRYRSVNNTSDKRVLLNAILNARNESIYTHTLRKGGKLTGILSLSRLDWDSEFFGRSMTRLNLFVTGDERHETAKTLLKSLQNISFLSDHVTLSLDAEDFEVRLAAENFGFRVMDTLCTYEHVPGHPGFPENPEEKFQIRRYTPDDREALLGIAGKCFSGYGSRFYNDPTFGADEAARLYLAWAENCCSGEMAEIFCSRSTGVKLLVFSDGACTPTYRNTLQSICMELAWADAFPFDVMPIKNFCGTLSTGLEGSQRVLNRTFSMLPLLVLIRTLDFAMSGHAITCIFGGEYCAGYHRHTDKE